MSAPRRISTSFVRDMDQLKIVDFLEALGYETLHKSRGFSNHLHPLSNLGRIDFVYVNDETAEILFAETKSLPVFQGLSIPVLRAETPDRIESFCDEKRPAAVIARNGRHPTIDATGWDRQGGSTLLL